MVRWFSIRILMIVLTLAVLSESTAHAQRGRRIRAWAAGRPPLVRVVPGPYGTAWVRAPLVAVDPGGVRVGLRRRWEPLPAYQPHVAASPTYRPAAQPAHATQPQQQLITAEELAGLSGEQLQGALHELNAALQARLARFDTGQGWQEFLRLTDDLTPTAMRKLEGRFAEVAANPQYGVIYGLPNFRAMRLAVAESVRRLPPPTPLADSPIMPSEGAVDKSSEELPLPGPALVPADTADSPSQSSRERSILK